MCPPRTLPLGVILFRMDWQTEGWTNAFHFQHTSRVRAELSLCQNWRRLMENCELQSVPNKPKINAKFFGWTDRQTDGQRTISF